MGLPYRLSWKQLLGLVGIAFLGTSLVVAGLVALNSFVEEREERDGPSTVSFTVPPTPEERPPEPPEPRRREPRRSNRPALAPPPSLGSSLSGIQVSLPEFQAQGVRNISEDLLGDLEDVALTESTVDQPPVTRNAPAPPYPARAKQREIEGQVRLSVLVGADGRVNRMKVLEATPPGVFEESVLNSVRNWTFRPASYNGEPVETWVTIPIPFRLN